MVEQADLFIVALLFGAFFLALNRAWSRKKTVTKFQHLDKEFNEKL